MVKNPPANVGDTDSIPGSRRSPGEGNGNPLQYSCLVNFMDCRIWWAIVHGVSKKLDMTQQLHKSEGWVCFHTYIFIDESMHFLSPSASEAHFRLFSSQSFASIETTDGLFSKCNVSLEINFLLLHVVCEMIFMC